MFLQLSMLGTGTRRKLLPDGVWTTGMSRKYSLFRLLRIRVDSPFSMQLDCCSGVNSVAAPTTGQECSDTSACAALGLEGRCCPTDFGEEVNTLFRYFDGMRLS
jgi:hypothetical protein